MGERLKIPVEANATQETPSGCPKHGCAWEPITSIGGTYMGCPECTKDEQEMFDKLIPKVNNE